MFLIPDSGTIAKSPVSIGASGLSLCSWLVSAWVRADLGPGTYRPGNGWKSRSSLKMYRATIYLGITMKTIKCGLGVVALDHQEVICSFPAAVHLD